MQVLLHEKLSVPVKLRASFEKVCAAIVRDDFYLADLKKLSGGALFRAKLDYDSRLVVRFVEYGGRRACLGLEVVEKHAYDRSRFAFHHRASAVRRAAWRRRRRRCGAARARPVSRARSEALALSAEQRKVVHALFGKYCAFLAESGLYDTNLVAASYKTKVEPRYDAVVVDEVQDLTNAELTLILARSLRAASCLQGRRLRARAAGYALRASVSDFNRPRGR